MTDQDLAYIAWLFEQRGYAWCAHPKASKNGKRYNRLTTKIAHGDRETLEWVAQTMGYGRVYNKGDKSGDFEYKLSYKQAKKFLQAILPFLVTKTTEVRDALVESYGRTEAGV